MDGIIKTVSQTDFTSGFDFLDTALGALGKISDAALDVEQRWFGGSPDTSAYSTPPANQPGDRSGGSWTDPRTGEVSWLLPVALGLGAVALILFFRE